MTTKLNNLFLHFFFYFKENSNQYDFFFIRKIGKDLKLFRIKIGFKSKINS